MATNMKYVSHTGVGIVTLYTVPSDKVAQVFYVNSTGTYSGSIGGYGVSVLTTDYTLFGTATGSPFTQMVRVGTNFLPYPMYMGSGQSILLNTAGSPASFSFFIIEDNA
jgi:hypothetical protein